MAGQWRRQTRKQQQIGAGAGSQIVAEVFDAVKLVGADPGTPDANTLYKGLIPKAVLNFKDIAGTITVNRAINCTVGFRTGTTAGDYTVTFTRAFADALYSMSFCVLAAPGNPPLIVAHNCNNILKTTTAWNFFVQLSGAGTPTRPTECNLIFYGDQ